MQSSPILCYLIPLKPKYFSQHCIIVNSQPLSLRDQVLNQYEKTDNITILYFFIFIFVDGKLEDNSALNYK
jgi:hypothetical protein